MRVCCLSCHVCVVVLFEGFVSWQRVSVACFPPNNTLNNLSWLWHYMLYTLNDFVFEKVNSQ